MIMVTHHVEEIPVGFSHALLLRNGAVVAAGPIDETITSELIGETFGLPVHIEERDGRFSARAAVEQQV
jgi:iron complex transport system ATP-binding protein